MHILHTKKHDIFSFPRVKQWFYVINRYNLLAQFGNILEKSLERFHSQKKTRNNVKCFINKGALFEKAQPFTKKESM